MAEKTGEIYFDIGADVSGLLNAQKTANKSLDSIGSSANSATKQISQLTTGISRLAGAIAASIVIEFGKNFLKAADAVSQLQSRIARLSPDLSTAKQTFSDLADIASATGAGLRDTAKLWETLTASLKDAGATNEQVLNLTETLQKIGRIGGSSAEEMANALRQFGQSIASGVIRAEEFNSILEQMPELARQIAAGLGVSMGQLRQMMLEGKLTAEDALNAIQSRTGDVNAEFAKLPRTMDQATGSLEISFAKLVGSINEATGATSLAVEMIDNLARFVAMLGDNSTSTADKVLSLAGALSKLSVGSLGSSVVGFFWPEDAKKKQSEYEDTVNRFIKSSQDGYAAAKKLAEGTKKISLPAPAASGKKKTNAGKSQAQKDAEQYARSQAEVTQRLEDLKQKSEVTAGSVGELSRAQSILTAQQSLGKSATEEQIRLAGEYAAKIWDSANALRKQAQEQQANKGASQVIAQGQATPPPGMGFGAQDPFAVINQQEQQKLEAYQQFRDQDLISQQTYEQVKTAIAQDAATQRLQVQQNEIEQQRQYFDTVLGGTQQFFSSMTDAIGNYAGEASSAYKAMFAVSKAFSVAQAGMNLVMAISNAAALPWPANIPAIAVAAAQGAALVSQISSMSYGGGRKNGGPVSAGSMYQVGENGMPEIYQASTGKQYMIPGDNGKVISNKDLSGGGGPIQVSIQFNDYSSGTHSYDAQATQNGDYVTINAFIMDMDQGGQMSQSIIRNIQAQRRARE
ncbi:tape measure protein [Yokenella regensburgei]|uniref:tape measure protein n=1 Tax=Yokenella regensburgei TaxID=158877 RepID=UPI001432D44D|nr:tape measure protein [Yokenella regensburgei]QIU89394.1 tape measure protein [Yokenella regensburgei]